MKKAIDVSHWNMPEQLYIADIEYDTIIAKASEGKTMKDFTCINYFQYAMNFEKKFGIYHYARPEINIKPEEEAKNFNEIYMKFPKTKIELIALDIEGDAFKNTAIDEWAYLWCEIIKDKTLIKPMIYCSQSNCKKFEKTSKIADLWVARWGSNMGNIEPWENAKLWQYTSKPIDQSIICEKEELT